MEYPCLCHYGYHDHLLLETPEANLVSGMSWFQTAFTVRGNRQSGQCGHVSAGRYASRKALALTRETLLAKKKSPPGKIAMGMLIKETTGLNHKDIATLLNRGHPVRSARLINEALKTQDLDSPVMRYYDQLIQVVRRQWGGLSAMLA